MARVDYSAIEDAIETVLKADANLAGVKYLVEEELVMGTGDIIGIYLEDRNAPEGMQSVSAGKRTRFLIRFSVWCWHFGIAKNKRLVMEKRDDLLGKAEIALMGNRNLNDTVNTSWLEGGEFESGKDEAGRQFMSGGQIILTADATAVS